MEWLQVLTIAGSTIGACWWFKKDSDEKLEGFQKEFRQEMKDFHGRLCTLEERYHQLMQKMWEDRSGK